MIKKISEEVKVISEETRHKKRKRVWYSNPELNKILWKSGTGIFADLKAGEDLKIFPNKGC